MKLTLLEILQFMTFKIKNTERGNTYEIRTFKTVHFIRNDKSV